MMHNGDAICLVIIIAPSRYMVLYRLFFSTHLPLQMFENATVLLQKRLDQLFLYPNNGEFKTVTT